MIQIVKYNTRIHVFDNGKFCTVRFYKGVYMPKNEIKIIDKIKVFEIGSLKADIQNTRSHSDEQIKAIAEAIKEFGFVNPVVVNSKKEVKAGHGRIMAAKLLGMKKVPTIDVSYLTKEQAKAYAIADNKLGLMSSWDTENLRNTLVYLDNTKFDLSVTGFSEIEITKVNKDFDKMEILKTLDENKKEDDNKIKPASGKVIKHESSSVNISMIMTTEQKDLVLKAIDLISKDKETSTYGESIFEICKEYLKITG